MQTSPRRGWLARAVLLTLTSLLLVGVPGSSGATTGDADDCRDASTRCTAVWAQPETVVPGDTVTITGYTLSCAEPSSGGVVTVYADSRYDAGDGTGNDSVTGTVVAGPVDVSGDSFETAVSIPADLEASSLLVALSCAGEDGLSASTNLTVETAAGELGTAPGSTSAGARVEGEYAVIETLVYANGRVAEDGWSTPGDVRELTAVATPECAAGPCAISMTWRTSEPEEFSFDGTTYRHETTYGDDAPPGGVTDCHSQLIADLESGTVEFSVTGSEMRGGALVATELTGTATSWEAGTTGSEDGGDCELLRHEQAWSSSFVATLTSSPPADPLTQPGDQAGSDVPPVAADGPSGADAPASVDGEGEAATSGPGGVSQAQFEAGRPHVFAGVATAAEAPWDVAGLAVALLLALAVVLLIVFPSELFNSTLDAHYEEIRAGFLRRVPWLDRASAVASEAEAPPIVLLDEAVEGDVPASGDSPRGWLAFLGVTAASALLYGLLDPGFGPNTASAVMLVGVAAGVGVATLLSVATSGWLAKRRFGRSDYYFRVLPATLLVAVACVAISRLVGFVPGYLYGLVGGIAFRQVLEDEDEARTVLVSSLVVLGAAIAGWVAYGPVAARIEAGSAGFGWLALEAVLAGTFIAGVEGLLFALVPLRFLSGHTLLVWSRSAWVATYGLVAFTFVHLVARPAAGEASAVSWGKTLALFGLFGAASIGFWDYWRRRDAQAAKLLGTTEDAPTPGKIPVSDVPAEPS